MASSASSGNMFDAEIDALSPQKSSLRVYALLIRPDHGARNERQA